MYFVGKFELTYKTLHSIRTNYHGYSCDEGPVANESSCNIELHTHEVQPGYF